MSKKNKVQVSIIEDQSDEITQQEQEEEPIEKPKPKSNEYKQSPTKPKSTQPKQEMAQQELIPPKELIEKPTIDYIEQFKALQSQFEVLHQKIDKLPQRRVRKKQTIIKQQSVKEPVKEQPIEKPQKKEQQKCLENISQQVPQIMFF